MRVFHYDNHGLFVGEGRAEIDPMETRKQKKAIYLIPGGATKTPPPRKLLEQDNTWKFDGESWIDVIDPMAQSMADRIEKEAQAIIAEAEKEAQIKAQEIAQAEAYERDRIAEEIAQAERMEKKAQLESRLNAIKDRTGDNIVDLNEDLKAIADILLEKL